MITKKVKSFSVEEESYEKLYEMLRSNLTDVTISFYVNKFIKELLGYFDGIDKVRRLGAYTIPLPFIIDSFAKESMVLGLDVKREPESGELDSKAEMEEWQRRYDLFIRQSGGGKQVQSDEGEKKYPLADVAKYVGRVAALQAIKGRDLTDEEMKDVFADYGGNDFRIYLRKHVLPALEKVDIYGKIERAVKKRKHKKDEDSGSESQ